MKYYEIKLSDGEEIKFRLTSSDSVELEKKTGRSILDLIDDYSVTNITTFLKYMRRSEIPQFSEKDAFELYDKLTNDGYTMESIVLDIIYEGLCVSGFFKRENLEELKKEITQVEKKK